MQYQTDQLINPIDSIIFYVEPAPSFQLPAYVVYPKSSNNVLIEVVLNVLKQVVAEIINRSS